MQNITGTDNTSDNNYNITLIGIFVNLSLNLLMLLERIITRVGKSECHAGHDGVGIKVDNSKENA